MDLPKLKERVNTEKISVAVDGEMKRDLENLKYLKRVNVSEWIRQLVRRELPKVKDW